MDYRYEPEEKVYPKEYIESLQQQINELMDERDKLVQVIKKLSELLQ